MAKYGFGFPDAAATQKTVYIKVGNQTKVIATKYLEKQTRNGFPWPSCFATLLIRMGYQTSKVRPASISKITSSYLTPG